MTQIITQVISDMTPSELTQAESVIDRGMHTFVEVGNALLQIRAARGYRLAGCDTFEVYCRERWGMSKTSANRLIQSASVIENLTPIGVILPLTESQARPLAQLESSQQIVAWQRAVETAPHGKVTAAHVQSVVNELRPVSYHVSDDSYEWFTPKEYIEAARAVMGSIDLDPASCAAANAVVKANKFHDKQSNGLTRQWGGNVWLNPPYNMPLIAQFIDKAIDAYAKREIKSAIILTNNSTDTTWFHKLVSYPVCFTKGRLQFWQPSGEVLMARQGQAFFYLGNAVKKFNKVFSDFGVIMARCE